MSPSVSSNATSLPIEISVLVPVMNEAGNILPLVNEICSAFKGRRFEIIYVDDASTDSTAAELADLLKSVPELRVLCHANRSGQSAAIWSGLWQARGDLIGVIDGDGQNVPADFLALETAFQTLGDTPGMVAGIRQHRSDGSLRMLASQVARLIRVILLSDTHPDSGCGIKILPRSLFLKLPFFNHMHRFMPSLVRRHGGAVIGLPVKHRPRQAGNSKYRILDRLFVGISDIVGVIWLLRRAPKSSVVREVSRPFASAPKINKSESTKKRSRK